MEGSKVFFLICIKLPVALIHKYKYKSFKTIQELLADMENHSKVKYQR